MLEPTVLTTPPAPVTPPTETAGRVADAAYIDNAAKIAAEVAEKFAKQEPASAAVEVATQAPPAPPTPAPAPAKPAAYPILTAIEAMTARLAALENARAPQTPPAPEPPPTQFDPTSLQYDLPGVLKQYGITPEAAARQLLGAVQPQALTPEQRAQADDRSAMGRLQAQLNQAVATINQLQAQVLRGEYSGQVRDVVSDIKQADFPAVAAAVKNDPKYVSQRVMSIAQEHARAHVGVKGAQPMTPAEAVAKLEAELQTTARLIGVTVGNSAAAPAPAAVAPTTAREVSPTSPKAPPVVPAASALAPSAPSTGTPPQSWETFLDQTKNDVIRKFENAN